MYWPPLLSGIRKRARMRPPSSGETVASSRRVTKAGPSTPVKATLAMTRDHSPVLSSARSILVSGTTRTRQPSESRICLTALAPGASLSRTSSPTWRGSTSVGLVLTIPNYIVKAVVLARNQEAATYWVTGRPDGGCQWFPRATELLANVKTRAAEIAQHARAIPENTECGCGGGGEHAGIEDLQAIAGPFRGAAPLIRGTKNRAAPRMQFEEEETRGQSHSVLWGASRSRHVISGNQEQIGIERMHADRV